jgi:hypothetical protein
MCSSSSSNTAFSAQVHIQLYAHAFACSTMHSYAAATAGQPSALRYIHTCKRAFMAAPCICSIRGKAAFTAKLHTHLRNCVLR